jgi:uncharacterized membrane protein YdfJ with MMPL/SSD domain
VVLSLVLAATSLHGLSSNPRVTGTPDSRKAAQTLVRAFPARDAQESSDVVVVSSAHYGVTSPVFQAFDRALVERITATPGARNVQSYLTGPPGLVSRGGHATLIRLTVSSDSEIKPVLDAVTRAGRSPAFELGLTGAHAVGNDFTTLSQRDLENGELAFGLPAALVVLVLVFGAIVAGLIPVILALLSILVAVGAVALLSLEFSLSVFVINMITGMGLALGIDYSLFVISRYREERIRGAGKDEAIARAGGTASRAVLFSGTTFVVAMLGMLVVPTTVMRSLAAGAIVVGLITVAAALTLLPALLSLLGDRVNRGRVPLAGRRVGRPGGVESRLWRGVVQAVLRRPLTSLVVSGAVMLAACVPLVGLHIGASGVQTLPDGLPSKQGYHLLQRTFPTDNPYPMQVVAVGGGDAARRDLAALERRLAADPRFGPGVIAAAPSAPAARVVAPTAPAARVAGPTASAASVVALAVNVAGDPVAAPAISAVREVRERVIPRLFAASGARVYVGGKTAETADYFDAVSGATPYVFAAVLGLSFVVLLLAFRSVPVALVSIALNLLSVGAAYGLLTLVFLDGVGTSHLGFQGGHAIEAWVPLFLFSVLFGLSMDYQMFLMSRIKERHDLGDSTAQAVAAGVASTARIITGAALIIIVVFIGFARGQLVMFQQMGFGVAVALLLDATIIRSVLLPSALALLGERSWSLPRWLEWLPRLRTEGPAGAEPVTALEHG